MRIILLVFAAMSFLYSCSGNKESKPEQPITTQKQDTLPYFDVADMILKDLMTIEASSNTFYQLTQTMGKRDSTTIDKSQVVKLASPFIELKLNNPAIKKSYTETPFYDSLTRSFVLIYKTDKAELPTKSVTLMLTDPQQEFKRADFMRYYKRNDSTFEERLSYTAGKQFQIVQLISAGGTELTKTTNVYWRERK
jgi:hypothetical protein